MENRSRIDYYKNAFIRLNCAYTYGRRILAKPIFILSIIESIEQGFLVENRIEWKKAYLKSFMICIMKSSQFICTMNIRHLFTNLSFTWLMTDSGIIMLNIRYHLPKQQRLGIFQKNLTLLTSTRLYGIYSRTSTFEKSFEIPSSIFTLNQKKNNLWQQDIATL